MTEAKQSFDENTMPVAVEIRDRMLLVTLKDGCLIGTPLDWYPRLAHATPQQLANDELGAFGIHRPKQSLAPKNI